MISEQPRSAARRDKASLCLAGMPRKRQQLTAAGLSDNASATILLPPKDLMTESGVSMEANLVCMAQTCQEFANRKTTFAAECDAIGIMIDPPEIIGNRLAALQKELGFKNDYEFAEKLGIDKSTYSSIKNGRRNLSFETACVARREWGVSIDWLFFGDLQQVAVQTMAKIGRGTPSAAESSKKKRKTG